MPRDVLTSVRRRSFGRLRWPVGEIGCGTWGMGGWSGADDRMSMAALQSALDHGVNFFDTAQGYGDGHSERLLGRLRAQNPDRVPYIATKIRPKTGRMPQDPADPLEHAYPADYIRDRVEVSLANLGTDSIDLMQFHAWSDDWAADDRWQRCVSDLKAEGLVRAWGISINRWQSWNGVAAVQTGMIDSVQVVYNIFDQAAAEHLFPVCADLDVAVIARVPFDEGALTGMLSRDSSWPEGDWRNGYFTPDRLQEAVQRAEALKAIVPHTMSLPELALRFILAHPAVTTSIPGMRNPVHVERNTAVSDGRELDAELLETLWAHRWDRETQPPAHGRPAGTG